MLSAVYDIIRHMLSAVYDIIRHIMLLSDFYKIFKTQNRLTGIESKEKNGSNNDVFS